MRDYLEKYPANFSYEKFPKRLRQGVSYFSNGWFDMNVREFDIVLSKIGKSVQNILEVGSYEGRSTLFMLDHCPRARIVCIDPFLNDGTSYNESGLDTQCKRIFLHNTAAYRDRITLMQEKSSEALPKLLASGRRFDLIYIDGSHMSDSVFADSMISARLLTPGGVVLFDDYGHFPHAYPDLVYLSPPVAINLFFRHMYHDHFKVVYKAYSIGFQLIKPLPPVSSKEINILKDLHHQTKTQQKVLEKWTSSDHATNNKFYA